MAGRRVLITGVATKLGAQLALRLEADPEIEHLIGVDVVAPTAPLRRMEFIEVDIREPEVMSILPATRVDVVVHNNILRRPRKGMSPQTAHDINVIGTLQLLTACERADTLKAIVVRGSAGIYGSEPSAPQFFTEEMSRLYANRSRFGRDVSEIEAYFENFARRRPNVVCTMLRYQPALGISLNTQVTRYLAMPVLPTFLGYDPRLQFVHEHDGLEALVAAVRNPVRGAVNVASRETIGLTRLARLARKPTLPLPPQLFPSVVGAGHRVGMERLSEDFMRLLRYGRGVELTRLEKELGYRPKFTTETAVRDYLKAAGGTPADVPEPAVETV